MMDCWGIQFWTIGAFNLGLSGRNGNCGKGDRQRKGFRSGTGVSEGLLKPRVTEDQLTFTGLQFMGGDGLLEHSILRELVHVKRRVRKCVFRRP
jgi:hypothetical protein